MDRMEGNKGTVARTEKEYQFEAYIFDNCLPLADPVLRELSG